MSDHRFQKSRLFVLVLCSLCGVGPAIAEDGHLELELNKVENMNSACRLTFRAANNYPHRLDDINVEVYLVNPKGVVLQSVQFPFGSVLPGRSRFAKFDIKSTACADIGGMFVNEFKSCKGSTDMTLQCLEKLKTLNLTGLKFNEQSP